MITQSQAYTDALKDNLITVQDDEDEQFFRRGWRQGIKYSQEWLKQLDGDLVPNQHFTKPDKAIDILISNIRKEGEHRADKMLCAKVGFTKALDFTMQWLKDFANEEWL